MSMYVVVVLYSCMSILLLLCRQLCCLSVQDGVVVISYMSCTLVDCQHPAPLYEDSRILRILEPSPILPATLRFLQRDPL